MGGIEREIRSIQRYQLEYEYGQMMDDDLHKQAEKIEQRVLSCLYRDDLEEAKYELSKLRLNVRLEEMLKHVDLRELHDALKLSRGRFNSTSWGIVDRIRANDCRR